MSARSPRKTAGTSGSMGVGIDLEEAGALERFDPWALRRFLERWFSVAEQAWCLAQPNLARALVAGVCCKEAAYKAVGATGLTPDRFEINLAGENILTTARASGNASPRAVVVWTTVNEGILALAMSPGTHTLWLPRLLGLGRVQALTRLRTRMMRQRTVGPENDGRAEPAGNAQHSGLGLGHPAQQRKVGPAVQHHGKKKLRTLLPYSEAVAAKGGTYLPGIKDLEGPGIELDAPFQIEKAIRNEIDTAGRGIIENDRPPGYPTQFSDQAGPVNAMGQKTQAHDCVE